MAGLKKTRRAVLTSTLALASSLISACKAGAAGMTPKAAEGPFYPTSSQRMSDVDNDLVKVAGLVQEAGGEVIRLKGKIMAKDGTARVGHRIEIWQCDLNGKYLHPGDNRDLPYDQGFQGFGHDVTAEDGSYSFRTIKPTQYPGRTPHIHVKVFEGEQAILTTQLYVQGDENNSRDGLFRRLSAEQSDMVSMVFTPSNGELETTVNIVV